MTPNNYYLAHLHMHSCIEGTASIEGHMFQGQKLGFDAIWFTDHDSRIGLRKSEINSFDFENGVFYKSTQEEDEEKASKIIEMAAKLGIILDRSRIQKEIENAPRYEGFRLSETENTANASLELTGENYYTLPTSMLLSAQSHGGGMWETVKAYYNTSGKRHNISLLANFKLQFAMFLKPFDMLDTRLIIEINLSQRPPDFKKACIKYILGDTSGLGGEHTAVKSIACPFSQWTEILLNVSEDIIDFDIGGIDNVFDSFSIIFQVKNGAKAAGYFDDFRFTRDIFLDDLKRKQQETADSIGKKYGITPFVCTEISSAGQHKICFGTHVPLIDYSQYASGKLSDAEAADHVKKHGGIFSLNHPFEKWKRVPLTKDERYIFIKDLLDRWLSVGCFGASMLEVGFPDGRHNFELDDYLYLWDSMSRNGLFITGYGDSDNHSNNLNWFEGNNFAVWIYADEPTEENFMASMKNGNLYTGDPVIFKGSISFKTSDGHRMGQVIKAEKDTYELSVEFKDISPGWTIKWVLDGEHKKESKTNDTLFVDDYVINIDKDIRFVRLELYDENNRCILLTNPIYFVSSSQIDIPLHRLS